MFCCGKSSSYSFYLRCKSSLHIFFLTLKTIWYLAYCKGKSGLSKVCTALIWNIYTSRSYKWPSVQSVFPSLLSWSHANWVILRFQCLQVLVWYLAQQGWRIFGDIVVWSQWKCQSLHPSASSLYKIMCTSCQAWVFPDKWQSIHPWGRNVTLVASSL